MKCVGENPEGGFFCEVDVLSRSEGRTGHGFEAAEKALNVPSSPIAGLLKSRWSHFRTENTAQGAVGTRARGFDHALHAPNLPAHAVNPVRVITGIPYSIPGR